jgi:hypothetical protein
LVYEKERNSERIAERGKNDSVGVIAKKLLSKFNQQLFVN